MKEETRRRKMMEALGLADVFQAAEEEKANRNKVVSIPEDKIQDFRAAQGVIYFLQAPELFTAKVCKHCGESFLVSRQFVALCSYTCIEKDLEERGFKWRRGADLEALAQSDVYEGNEPIWVRNLPSLTRALEYLTSHAVNSENPTTSLTG